MECELRRPVVFLGRREYLQLTGSQKPEIVTAKMEGMKMQIIKRGGDEKRKKKKKKKNPTKHHSKKEEKCRRALSNFTNRFRLGRDRRGVPFSDAELLRALPITPRLIFSLRSRIDFTNQSHFIDRFGFSDITHSTGRGH